MLRKVCNHRKQFSVVRHRVKYLSTAALQETENVKIENVSEDLYPEIEDLSPGGKREKQHREWSEGVKNCPTVEEKLFKVNMPKYYGFRVQMFDENYVNYNILPVAQYITKTHLVNERKLPTCYDHMTDPSTLDQLVANIKKDVEDILVLELEERRQDSLTIKDKTDPVFMDKLKTKSIIRQINRLFANEVSQNSPHILECETEYDPRIEAFWLIGNMPPSKRLIKTRKHFKYQPAVSPEEDPIHNMIQYIGEPLVQLRSPLPLREIVSIEESEDRSMEVPEFRYNLRATGYNDTRRHVATIPGFWPGHPNEFGVISFHHQAFLKKRSYLDDKEALVAQAIMASFGWLMGQACYQGFSPYNDITYPLVNQAVITDGQTWSFFVYQMNTTDFSTYAYDKIAKRNICWASEPMKLYESVENGKVNGLDVEVLKNLFKFYINAPEQRDYNMKPYLDEVTPVIADYEDVEKKTWLEKRFKHLMSNRPRHSPLPEILQWQKIFMIDNRTRPMEKKHEPWEYGINPYARTLDNHLKNYIPKALRPHPKKKYKWELYENQYYPK